MKWKNIAEETTAFFVTATVTEWQPLLLYERARRILLEDFDFYRRRYKGGILAYVIMPEHYHMVVNFKEQNLLHSWLRDVQGHSAREISRWLMEPSSAVVSGHPCPETERPPTEMLAIFAKHANGRSKLAVWKEQARAVGIITESVLRAKIDYIHQNPVRRRLVENPGDWPWSSWRSHHGDGDSALKVDWSDIL